MNGIHRTGVFDQHEEATINRYPHFKGVHSIGDMMYTDGLPIDLVMLAVPSRHYVDREGSHVHD